MFASEGKLLMVGWDASFALDFCLRVLKRSVRVLNRLSFRSEVWLRSVHQDEEPSAGLIPFSCCSRSGFGHLPVVCQQRWVAIDGAFFVLDYRLDVFNRNPRFDFCIPPRRPKTKCIEYFSRTGLGHLPVVYQRGWLGRCWCKGMISFS